MYISLSMYSTATVYLWKLFVSLQVQKTFKTEFNQYHQTWKGNRYDWLPTKEQIPKDLSEETPSEHLQALEVNITLLN